MTSTPYELEPSDWRNILARSAIYHALRTRLVAIGDLAERGGPVQSLLNDLAMLADACSSVDVEDEDVVRRVVEAWDAEVARKLELASLDEDVRKLLTDAKDLAHEACGSDPFRRLFERISDCSRILYGESWRPPTLVLGHVRSHPRSSMPHQDPYGVTASCTPPSGSTDMAAVQLLIFCEAFGPAAYAAVPSLLVHECVCHVAAKQEAAKNNSVFAEGLMDWVAYYFLDAWATGIDKGLSAAARTHADKLRRLLVEHGTAEGRARRLGHLGAETLRSWFECQFGYLPYEAKTRVSLLAIGLNQVDRPLEEKEVFVTKLSDPMPPDLEDALRAWEQDGDTEALLAAAVA